MQLLFLNPPLIDRFSRTGRRSALMQADMVYYPIWLAYAAGVAEQAGYNIRLRDAPQDELHFQGLPKDENILASQADFIPDLVIVETSAYSIHNDVDVVKKIKAQYPHTFIVMVGTYPSAVPEEVLKLSQDIDAVAIGEYEFTIRDLARALEDNQPLETVDGIVFRYDGKVVKNKERIGIEDLDTLPFVSSIYKRHLNYRNYSSAVAHYPVVMIITSRGCPFQCPFCVYPQVFHGHKYNVRSAEDVVGEFEYIADNFPEVKEIGIEDDCFTIDKERVARICELLIEKGIKVKWHCNVRADLDYSLLKKMKEAGCRLVSVGFESACQIILDNIHKEIRTEQYYQFVKDAKRAGILVEGCFMIGNPGDTRETLAQSYRFARKINCDRIRFYPLYLYPGTEAFNWAQKNGYVKRDDFSDWLREDGLQNCVLNNPELPPKDMVYLSDYYEKRYYLRPRYLFMKLWQSITNHLEGRRNLKMAKTFLAKVLKDQAHRSR